MLESHEVLIPPLGKGKAIPNDENQVKSGCRVRNTTAQNIHLVKLPPIANAAVPSCRKAIPASTSDSKAADGASRSSREITSFSNCGVGIAFNLTCYLHNGCRFAESHQVLEMQLLQAVCVRYGAVSGQVTPPVPFVIQNSISRVTPEMAKRAAAANSQRPNPRPVSQQTTAPSTAPPAPTGAITFPTQLMKLRKAPSGWAPVCPWTATFEAGAEPRFWAHANC